MKIDNYIKELNEMPYHIIDKVVFDHHKMTIHFKSGNSLLATNRDPQFIEATKLGMLKNLDRERVIIL